MLASRSDAQARPRFSVIGAAGAALAVSQPGPDRDIGRAGILGVEVDHLRASGLAERFAFRLEGGLTSQKLATPPGPISGDVQTAHIAALATMRLATSRDREIYAVAGPMWARPSEKFVLDARNTETPGSNFEQTTHQTTAGAIIGAGVAWHVRTVGVRAETRWMSLATDRKTTAILPLMVAVVVPVRR
jgi:hypothetical protein